MPVLLPFEDARCIPGPLGYEAEDPNHFFYVILGILGRCVYQGYLFHVGMMPAKVAHIQDGGVNIFEGAWKAVIQLERVLGHSLKCSIIMDKKYLQKCLLKRKKLQI